MLHVMVGWPAHTAHHAIAARAALPRESGGLDEFLDALHFVDGDIGARDSRLRAIAAVLGTDAALRVAQNADFHAASKSRLAYFAGRGEQGRQMRIGAMENRARFVAG